MLASGCRGQAYSGVGDGAAAVRDLEKALALSPESEKGAIKEKLEEAQQKQRHESRGEAWQLRLRLCCASLDA